MDTPGTTTPPASGSTGAPFGDRGPRSELHAGLRLSRPVALADLTDDLLWPKLLKVPRLALRPASIGIALFALLAADLISLVGNIGRKDNQIGLGSLMSDELLRGVRTLLGEVRDGLLVGDAGRVVEAFVPLVTLPRTLWQDFSWGALVAIPMAIVLLIGAGAICRIAACEIAHGLRLSWVDGLGFGLRKWRSLFLSIAGPALLAGAIFLGVAVFGWLLFSLSWTQWAGAVLFPVVLLAGLLGAILLVLTIVGAPLMAPAIACEGGDAIEGVQRAYAYVPSRPLRYVLYLAVLTLSGWVAVTLATALGLGLSRFNAAAIGWLASDAPVGISNPAAQAEGFTGFVLKLWVNLPLMLATAYAMSVAFTGFTMVYLLLRRVVDGQHLSDIWMPGLLPGTVAARVEEPVVSGSREE
ncbi:MAG: hypothetical protein K2Y21_10215 [Phycisphaerales bacterium]|nr:hypothetical protein [Phycisphaerales bacterium]